VALVLFIWTSERCAPSTDRPRLPWPTHQHGKLQSLHTPCPKITAYHTAFAKLQAIDDLDKNSVVTEEYQLTSYLTLFRGQALMRIQIKSNQFIRHTRNIYVQKQKRTQ